MVRAVSFAAHVATGPPGAKSRLAASLTMVGNTRCSRSNCRISANTDSRSRSWVISGEGTGENPWKLPLDMLDGCKRARLWQRASPSAGCGGVNGVSDAGASEITRRFLLSRAVERSTIPTQTWSVHREQISHLLSTVQA